MEQLVILMPTKIGYNSVILSWSECLDKFKISSSDLKKAIDEGLTLDDGKWFVDESLTHK